MKSHLSAGIDQAAPRIGAEDAWRLWHRLQRLSSSIWETYEKEFLEFCIQEAEDQCYHLPEPPD